MIEFEGVEYDSVTAAARAHGVLWKTMRAWLDMGCRPTRKGSSVPVRIRGKDHASCAAAGRYYGVSQSAIHFALERGRLETVGLRRMRYWLWVPDRGETEADAWMVRATNMDEAIEGLAEGTTVHTRIQGEVQRYRVVTKCLTIYSAEALT